MMDLDVVASRGLDRATLRRLSQQSNARGALQLSAHLTLLGASGMLVWAARGHFWMAPAVVLPGIGRHVHGCDDMSRHQFSLQ